MSALLEIDDLQVAYDHGRAPVLRGVSLQVRAGQTLGIVGESGCGKSTLAHALTRLLPAGARQTGGRIRFDGRDLSALGEREMRDVRGSAMAMILQDPLSSLNPLLKIGTQVAEVAQRHLGMSRRQAWTHAGDLLASVRLAEPQARLHEYPHQLSGGMRQRVAGAIALAGRPRLLIADEPTTALDPTVQVQYLRLLKDLQRTHGFALVLITHDLGIVAQACDDVAVMYAGRIVESGPAMEVFDAPRHPYTHALLGSLPDLHARAGTLPTIAGQPPRPRDVPPGCAFHPRCGRSLPRCGAEVPALRANDASAAHAACWHPIAAYAPFSRGQA
ncbi:ABC transporter ATP-binding protein [Luteimonas sp. RIT-PG2_3]